MANRFLVAGGTGNFNSTTNWAATTGGASGASFPVAGDVVALDSLSGNAPLTVNVASACASFVMSGTYAGTLTYDANLTLTSTYTTVAACTIAGTAGTLVLSGAATLTSGGKTLTCGLTFGANVAYTLADNWSVNGLVTVGALTQTVNGNQITCAGGLHHVSAFITAGTTKFVLTGGTWDDAGSGGIGNSVDLAGNVTFSGSSWGAVGKTLRYVSGTITTTGSNLNVTGGTLDTAGVAWNSISFAAGSSVSLTSDPAWSGTLQFTNSSGITLSGAGKPNGTGAVTFTGTATPTFNNTGGLVTTGTLTLPNNNLTFAGTAGWTVGTLTTAALTASRTYTLHFGSTYTVTTAISSGATAANREALVSSSSGNKVVFNLTAGASNTLAYCDPVDIDSSGGAAIYSAGATITNSTNWTGAVVAGSGGSHSVIGCDFIKGGAGV